ncbi:MAG TPA: membrane protein insertase YidC [Geminicoccaceae bacterium]|nr:membrane protein insertase YidC [Geminicoccus sp.]HMU48608.1 membrane protein insertase YidC [Geminicoccaceae bacterium]
MTEQKNLILAIVLSIGIILAFQFFYELPRMERQREAAQQQASQQQAATPGQPGGTMAPQPGGAVTAGGAPAAVEAAPPAGPRVRIDNGRLHGSLALTGNRIDDVTLADYHLTVDPASPDVELLRPAGHPEAYFGEFGWVPAQQGIVVPDNSTPWTSDSTALTRDAPVTMTWDNGQGLVFGQKVALDDNYMFSVTRSVTNNGAEPVALHPYALLSRWGTPHTLGYYILHEGPIGVLGGTLHEIDYHDLQEDGAVELPSTGGWLGFGDKYWLAALVPDQQDDIKAKFSYTPHNGEPRYQIDYLGAALTVAPGSTVTFTDRMFTGAKEVDKLDGYADSLGIPLFDRAVDFGWFYFLTKPIFHVLDFFYRLTGNYGIAILLLTLVVKILFFPLANKSYRAMSQMKKLQPEMMALRERFADDKMKMNQELMALYKREKVNPMSGCLPIVVQIPVFFALYKVLFVNIEMRHAPFFGWIQDLSAPDPTTIFNLFGLIPWTPPHFLMIGVWPLLMGITMFLQTKLNPQPADPVQAKVMLFLPVMFTFLFATFPAGLVIYWTWNNILSISQQWVIMKRMGVANPTA